VGEIVVAVSIGNEIVEPSKVVLPIDRQPATFDAAVDGPHSVRRALSRVTPGANAPVANVSTPSELWSDVFSGLL
jgi:hypothetical protein